MYFCVPFALNYIIFFLFVINTLTVYANEDNPFILTSRLDFFPEINEYDTKNLTLYSLENMNNITVIATDLVDKDSGEIIRSDNIMLNGNSQLTQINIPSSMMKQVEVKLISKYYGIFNGSINLLENGKLIKEIPLSVNISKDSEYVIAILIFLAGFIVSYLLWAFTSYISVLNRFKLLKYKFRDLGSEIDRRSEWIKEDYFTYYMYNIEYYLVETGSYISESNIDVAEEKLAQAKDEFIKMIEKDNLDIDNRIIVVAGLYNIGVHEFLSKVVEKTAELRRKKPPKEILIRKFDYPKYIKTNKLGKMALMNISSLIVGLLISLGLLLQNDFIQSVNQWNITNIMILFGMGLGTENIKKLIEKIFDINK